MADSDIGRDGGIGRRAGLRIQCRKRRAGSSPVPGTTVFPASVEYLICRKSEFSTGFQNRSFVGLARSQDVEHYVAIPSLCVRIQRLNLIFNPGGAMIERNITLPEMILWTGTRVALGVGVGMLVSRGLSKDAMKAAGLALTIVGGFTTIPLAISIVGKKNVARPEIRSVA
jgi:hypothetical protein